MSKKKVEFILLNTNRACFLCYEDVPLCSSVPLSSSLKNIYRLLKVNLAETISIPDKKLLPILERLDVQVSLCEGCRTLTQKFSQLYREMEEIRMKVDNCLEAITDKMIMRPGPGERSESEGGLESDDKQDKRHSETVEKLRKEMMLKYRLYRKMSQPRIRLRKTLSETTNLEVEPTLTNLIKQEPPSMADAEDANDPTEYEEVCVTPDLSAFKTESNENGDLLQDKSQPSTPILEASEESRPDSHFSKTIDGFRNHKKFEAHYIEGRQGAKLAHPCKFCWNSFSTRFELGNHVTKAHSTAPKTRRFPCSLCHKSFFTKVDLQRHQRSVVACRPLQRQPVLSCKYCLRSFSTEYIRIQHEAFVCKLNPDVRTRREGPTSAPVIPATTPPPVASSSSRRKQVFHTRSHFICVHCGGFFTYEADLERHQKMDCEVLVRAASATSASSQQVSMQSQPGQVAAPRRQQELGLKSNIKIKPTPQVPKVPKVAKAPRSHPPIPQFTYQHVCQRCKNIFSTEEWLFKHQRLCCPVFVGASSVMTIPGGAGDYGVTDIGPSRLTNSEPALDQFNKQPQLERGEQSEESILPDPLG